MIATGATNKPAPLLLIIFIGELILRPKREVMTDLHDQYQSIIEHFEHVRNRPAMFMGEASERALYAYLIGFETACRLLECIPNYGTHSDFWKVCAERGWEENSFGPQKRMHDAGWVEEAIVIELLTIEIETWRRRQESLQVS